MRTQSEIENFIAGPLGQMVQYLQSRRRLAIIPAAFSQVFRLVGLAFFVNCFLQVFNVFFTDFPDDFGAFLYIFTGFFVLVGGLVFFNIIRGMLKPLVQQYFTHYASGPPMIIITLVGMAVFGVAAYEVFLFTKPAAAEVLHAVGAFLLSLVGAVVLFALSGLMNLLLRPFEKKYVKGVFPFLLKFLEPDSTYQPEQGVGQEVLINSELVPVSGTITRVWGSHHWQHEQAQMSWAKMKVKTVTRSGGKTKVEIKVVFDGLMFVNQGLVGSQPNMIFKKNPDLGARLTQKMEGWVAKSLHPGYTPRNTEQADFDRGVLWLMPEQVDTPALPVAFTEAIQELLYQGVEGISIINNTLYVASKNMEVLKPNLLGQVLEVKAVKHLAQVWEFVKHPPLQPAKTDYGFGLPD